MFVLVTLRHDLHARKVKHDDPKTILRQDLDGEKVCDLQLVSHRKAGPPLVNGEPPFKLSELHLLAVIGDRAENDLQWDDTYALTKGLADRK